MNLIVLWPDKSKVFKVGLKILPQSIFCSTNVMTLTCHASNLPEQTLYA